MIEGEALKWSSDTSPADPRAGNTTGGAVSGEEIAVDEPLNPKIKLAQAPASLNTIPAEKSEKLIWEQLGLKFGDVVDAKQLPMNFRGGLTVVEVDDKRFAPRGIRKGDVLVGLHFWETTSIDNVLYILTNAKSVSVNAGVAFRGCVVRDQQLCLTNVTFYSTLFDKDPPKPKSKSPDE